MMSRLATCCLFVLLTLAAGAQQPSNTSLCVRDLFKQMPDSIIPYLTPNNRLDMLDFWDSGMHADVKNELDGHSQLTMLRDSCLTVQLSEACRLDLVLLASRQAVDSVPAVVCAIFTLGIGSPSSATAVPAIKPRQSEVRFYSASWRRLTFSDLVALPPDDESFFSSVPYMAEWQPDSRLLCLKSCSFLDVPSEEGQDAVPERLISIKWDGKIFNKP